jgi:hypothetical protein
MPFDLVAYQESVARNGLAGIAVAGGEDKYKVSGDDLYTIGDGRVELASCVTAAIANLDEWRFHRTLDANWNHSRMFARDQTGAVDRHNLMFTGYPFFNGDILRAEADNGNNAQIESVGLALVYGDSPQLSLSPPPIPRGAFWMQGAGGTAAVANTWVKSSMTWSATLNYNQLYRVLGMVAYSATGYWARLYYKGSSPAKDWRPGCPMGDTAILSLPLYGDFGSFRGDQPPDVQVLCSGTDAAQYIDLLVLPLGG